MIGMNAEYQAILLLFTQIAFETALTKFTSIKCMQLLFINEHEKPAHDVKCVYFL